MNLDKFEKILASKEKRAKKQKELIFEYKAPLISFTLNIPGINKNQIIYTNIHIDGVIKIKQVLKRNNIEILYIEERAEEAGREAFIIFSGSALAVKKLTIELEDKHPLGRLYDIDVFDEKYNQISRSELGKEMRKCFICKNQAVICARNRTHSIDDLYSKINEIIDNWTQNGGIL